MIDPSNLLTSALASKNPPPRRGRGLCSFTVSESPRPCLRRHRVIQFPGGRQRFHEQAFEPNRSFRETLRTAALERCERAGESILMWSTT